MITEAHPVGAYLPYSVRSALESPFASCYLPQSHHLRLSWKEEITLPRCELAVMSPGVRRGTPLFRAAERMAPRVASELEFALEHISCPIAAITGTNGKTTQKGVTPCA